MKILLVEDQQGPLKLLAGIIIEAAINFNDYQFVIATSYKEAKINIENGVFDIVLLDHRLPYEDQGDLENTDFDKFCESLQNVGYGLITEIKRKNPNCIVIGTSSMKEEALRLGRPDFSIEKLNVTSGDLKKIMAKFN